ncbi:MAG TPA: hypothetical protein VN805_03850 [Caulobacteraceae bacterium]|nr:hypothetical protein [Caulobacteraceae bacterium]
MKSDPAVIFSAEAEDRRATIESQIMRGTVTRDDKTGKWTVTPAAKGRPRNPEPDDPKQSARFIEAAKAVGVDESGDAFDKAFKKITRSSNQKR